MAQGLGSPRSQAGYGLALQMIKVFFIRHAKAGDRELWTDPDDLRPLTKPGHRQAKALVELLAGEEINRIFTSRYLRCVQTVEPLAESRSLQLETHEALVEGASTSFTLDLIEGADEPIAASTHGDVMENVIGHLQSAGIAGADARLGKKGSTWVLSVDSGRIVRAEYMEPPS
jgi:broad specificity phosphatase PhoE